MVKQPISFPILVVVTHTALLIKSSELLSQITNGQITLEGVGCGYNDSKKRCQDFTQNDLERQDTSHLSPMIVGEIENASKSVVLHVLIDRLFP